MEEQKAKKQGGKREGQKYKALLVCPLAQGTVLCVNWHKKSSDLLYENSDPLWV